MHDSLLHGETLLVVTTGNLEHVALELVTEEVSLNLLAHSLLVEASDSVLVLNINALLGALSGVCDVKLVLEICQRYDPNVIQHNSTNGTW